jgi:energy-coupling factor transporter ATP-binding protein EcfA2
VVKDDVSSGYTEKWASRRRGRYPRIAMSPFLTELHVKSFACLKDVKCTFKPIHALIGPNDSGKSTLLRAIQHVASQAYGSTSFFARFADRSDLRVNYGQPGVDVTIGGGQIMALAQATTSPIAQGTMAVRVGGLRPAHRIDLVRLDPDELRKPGTLIPEGRPLVLQGRGTNLASLYDALRDRSNDRFTAISQNLVELFPTVRKLGLRATADVEKMLVVELLDGTVVPGAGMSEGMLYFLAFAILGELQPPAAYLIEEPENGLHPSRIREVMGMLRTIAEGAQQRPPVQVIMATHSPLVVNELRPDEVTVVTRDPAKGTELHPIKETPHFEERSKVYALGELWLSYADGKAEAPLFDHEGR